MIMLVNLSSDIGKDAVISYLLCCEPLIDHDQQNLRKDRLKFSQGFKHNNS